jgi:hypothetical protein
MRLKILFVLLCCVIGVDCSLSTTPVPMPPMPTTPVWVAPSEWDLSIVPYPNAQTQYAWCNQTGPSWLCDPNQLLVKTQHDTVKDAVHNITNIIDCSAHNHCQPFSIALIRKIKVLNVNDVIVKLNENGKTILSSWLAAVGLSSGLMLFISTEDNQMEMIVPENVSSSLSKCVSKVSLQQANISERESLYQFILITIDNFKKNCGQSSSGVDNVAKIVVPIVIVIVCISMIIAIAFAIRAKHLRDENRGRGGACELPSTREPLAPGSQQP